MRRGRAVRGLFVATWPVGRLAVRQPGNVRVVGAGELVGAFGEAVVDAVGVAVGVARRVAGAVAGRVAGGAFAPGGGGQLDAQAAHDRDVVALLVGAGLAQRLAADLLLGGGGARDRGGDRRLDGAVDAGLHLGAGGAGVLAAEEAA